MYQLPTCSSRAQATIAGVGIEPPSVTTSSSELSWPDRSSTIDSSMVTSAASGSSSSSVSSRSISSCRRSCGITAALAVKAAASELLSCWICSSWRLASRPADAMPSRSAFSSGGRRRMTSARSSRVTLALADQIRSAAARFIALVCSLCAP